MMKAFYALILGLVLLPACLKKKSVDSDCCDHTHATERISGVEHAGLDLK